MLETLPEWLHVGRPNEGNRALFDELVSGMFDRAWYTNGGQLVQEFEKALCNILGVQHCIPVCNATVGLQLACHALGLKGEVILPAFTFIASAHALQWERLRPVFCEIDPVTHNLDPQRLEELITERTTAILGVHLWGRPCDVENIQAVADRHGLQVFYDAAHSFGAALGGRMIGNFGRCEVFSFHATKFIHSFEGGAIATNDNALAEKIRLMKNFGFSGMDSVIHLGTNGKMTEICAAMGLASLNRLNEILAVNLRNYELYRQALKGVPGVTVKSYDDLEKTNWQYIVIMIDEQEAGITRDELHVKLHAHRIRARRYFYPGCHQMEPYASLYPLQRYSLPLTDWLCQRVLVLPTGNAVMPQNIEYICRLIRNSIGCGSFKNNNN
jgi:dTDP-4-amino-4,6-dideoxygalactose transaminase